MHGGGAEGTGAVGGLGTLARYQFNWTSMQRKACSDSEEIDVPPVPHLEFLMEGVVLGDDGR